MSTVPYASTNYVIQAVCVHPERGMGVSSETVVNALQPIIAAATLPKFVKRGEKFVVRVVVHTRLESCVPITVRITDFNRIKLTHVVIITLRHRFRSQTVNKYSR